MLSQEWEAALQCEEQREMKSGRRRTEEQMRAAAIVGPGVSGAGDLSDDSQGMIAWIRGSSKVGRTITATTLILHVLNTLELVDGLRSEKLWLMHLVGWSFGCHRRTARRRG